MQNLQKKWSLYCRLAFIPTKNKCNENLEILTHFNLPLSLYELLHV